VATMVGLVAYVAVVARLALDYEKDALVVQGGWIAVRLLGIVAVVAAALLLNRVRDLRGRVARSGVALRRGQEPLVETARARTSRAGVLVVSAGFWVTALGASALLVTLAYWGAYQLGI
jgi:hypothetical protein